MKNQDLEPTSISIILITVPSKWSEIMSTKMIGVSKKNRESDWVHLEATLIGFSNPGSTQS